MGSITELKRKPGGEALLFRKEEYHRNDRVGKGPVKKGPEEGHGHQNIG